MHIFQPLRNKAFAGLWLSYSVSVAATAILPTIITLMILDWHDGFASLGIALSVRTFGFIAGAVAGGYFADRWPRQRVLCTASILRCLSTLAILLFFHDNIVAISCCLFFSGAGEGIFRSAYQATMADIVTLEQRQTANALTTLSLRVGLTAGPLLAVAINTSFGATWGLGLASMLWALSAIAILGLPQHLARQNPAHGRAATNFLADYRDGLAEVLRHRWFIAGLSALLIWLGIGNSIQQLMLPVVSRESLGGDAFIGIALGAYSVGALVGGVLLGSVRISRPGIFAFSGLALYGLVPLALYSHSPTLVVVSYFLGGIGIELFNIPWFTAIQNEVPKNMLGRVSSIDFLISYGAAPLTLAAMPTFITAAGQGPALVISGIVVLIVPLFALLAPGALRFRDPRIP
jgi:MFS family permease